MSSVYWNEREVTILDLLDRVLDKGVILFGDITISVADVDLVYVAIKALLTSVETAEQMRRGAAGDLVLPIAAKPSPPSPP